MDKIRRVLFLEEELAAKFRADREFFKHDPNQRLRKAFEEIISSGFDFEAAIKVDKFERLVALLQSSSADLIMLGSYFSHKAAFERNFPRFYPHSYGSGVRLMIFKEEG